MCASLDRRQTKAKTSSLLSTSSHDLVTASCHVMDHIQQSLTCLDSTYVDASKPDLHQSTRLLLLQLCQIRGLDYKIEKGDLAGLELVRGCCSRQRETESTYSLFILFFVSSEGGGGTYAAASINACSHSHMFRSRPNWIDKISIKYYLQL